MKPTKLPSGAWRCRVYLGKDPNGKSLFQSVTKTDYYDCLEEASKIAKHHHESERDNSLLTLEEAFDKYIQMKDGILSPSTIRSYTSIKENHLQSLMDKPLKKLTKNVVQSAINEESKDYAPKTVQNVFRALTAVMNQFTTQNLKITLDEPEERVVNILNEQQLKTLIAAIQEDKSEIPVLMALLLGLRRSEAMALTHNDFDPVTSTLTISKAKVPNKDQKFIVKKTKTKKSKRQISVPKYLADKLQAAIDRDEPFYNVAPERPYKRLQIICERCGLPKMSMHDLRHQNASIMLAIGIPDKYAMERGGWSTTSTMKKIYQHTISDRRKAVDEKMNLYMDQLTKGQKESAM